MIAVALFLAFCVSQEPVLDETATAQASAQQENPFDKLPENINFNQGEVWYFLAQNFSDSAFSRID